MAQGIISFLLPVNTTAIQLRNSNKQIAYPHYTLIQILNNIAHHTENRKSGFTAYVHHPLLGDCKAL